jgi:hypothetical protein
VSGHALAFFYELRLRKVSLYPLYRAARDPPGAGAVSPEMLGRARTRRFQPCAASGAFGRLDPRSTSHQPDAPAARKATVTDIRRVFENPAGEP